MLQWVIRNVLQLQNTCKYSAVKLTRPQCYQGLSPILSHFPAFGTITRASLLSFFFSQLPYRCVPLALCRHWLPVSPLVSCVSRLMEQPPCSCLFYSNEHFAVPSSRLDMLWYLARLIRAVLNLWNIK